MNLRPLSRRTVLHGCASAITLPFLEAMLPLGRARAAQPRIPTRLGFCEHSFGIWPGTWFPSNPGRAYDPSPDFEPMLPFREHLTIFSGLENVVRSDAHKAMEMFLCCDYADPDPSKDKAYGISIDQHLAPMLGSETRFPTMVLGSYDQPLYGTISRTLSKTPDGIPIPPDTRPLQVFAKLFGQHGSYEQIRHQLVQKRSVLDSTREEVRRLERRLGAVDRAKIDAYLTSIRQMEAELERLTRWSKTSKPDAPLNEPGQDPDIRIDSQAHIRLMFDLMIAAWQTDSSRLFTFHLPTLHTLTEIGATVGRHSQNHKAREGNDAQKMESRLGRFVLEQFAYLTRRLLETKEIDGSPMLDHCLIASGSSLEEAGRHRTKNLPVYLIGHGGGRIRQGQYLACEPGTPLANLFVTMAQEAGASLDTFKNSTGRMEALFS